jgi:hypothetical protein
MSAEAGGNDVTCAMPEQVSIIGRSTVAVFSVVPHYFSKSTFILIVCFDN